MEQDINNEVTKQPEGNLCEPEPISDSNNMVERDEHGRLKKGSILNPKGKSAGQKDYATLYKEALIMIAKSKGMTDEEIEQDLIQSGILRGIKGNFKFYQDVMDRIFGKPKGSLDVTSGGKPINNTSTIIFKDFDSIDEIEKENKEQNGTDSQ